MRIIAGSARGRRLFSPGAHNKRIQTIRPTSDRSREALFNIMGPDLIKGASVLDLFAGTGALGLESLSRGAASAVFVDQSSVALGLIKKNISTCGFSSTQVFKRDLMKGLFFLKKEGKSCSAPFTIVFIDPPYRQQMWSSLVAELLNNDLLAPGSVVVCEDSSSVQMPDSFAALKLYDERIYGDTGLWFYEY